jgi:hypothetical protein
MAEDIAVLIIMPGGETKQAWLTPDGRVLWVNPLVGMSLLTWDRARTRQWAEQKAREEAE